jgi:hypothetical protein
MSDEREREHDDITMQMLDGPGPAMIDITSDDDERDDSPWRRVDIDMTSPAGVAALAIQIEHGVQQAMATLAEVARENNLAFSPATLVRNSMTNELTTVAHMASVLRRSMWRSFISGDLFDNVQH